MSAILSLFCYVYMTFGDAHGLRHIVLFCLHCPHLWPCDIGREYPVPRNPSLVLRLTRLASNHAYVATSCVHRRGRCLRDCLQDMTCRPIWRDVLLTEVWSYRNDSIQVSCSNRVFISPAFPRTNFIISRSYTSLLFILQG